MTDALATLARTVDAPTQRARIICPVGEEPAQQAQASEKLQPSGEACEVCGTEMYGLHCKLVCPNCGYRRDCSDP